jgi:hypothetical protein
MSTNINIYDFWYDHPAIFGPPTRAMVEAATALDSGMLGCAYIDARVNGCAPREAYRCYKDSLQDMIEWADNAMGDKTP